MTTTLRTAIGAALDYPFSEEGFALVDSIEAQVSDLDFEGDPDHHETAAEIADGLVSVMSTLSKATLWAILAANDKGAEVGLYGSGLGTSTEERVTLDLYATIEEAVHAGLTFLTSEGRR